MNWVLGILGHCVQPYAQRWQMRKPPTHNASSERDRDRASRASVQVTCNGMFASFCMFVFTRGYVLYAVSVRTHFRHKFGVMCLRGGSVGGNGDGSTEMAAASSTIKGVRSLSLSLTCVAQSRWVVWGPVNCCICIKLGHAKVGLTH